MMAPRSRKDTFWLFPLAVSLAALLMIALPPRYAAGAAPKSKHKTFASPEVAVQALVDALGKSDKAELSAIFGPGSESVVSSGDDVTDRSNREKFLKAYAEKNSLVKEGDGKAILQVGNDDWPFPIPVVKDGSSWRFDTKAGKEEILNRRIGANELRTIDLLHAYVAAQREYAGRDPDADHVFDYAQRVASTPGKKDGLYWEAKEGEVQSPLGPLAAEAAREGYAKKGKSEKPVPYHGYYFRILTAQGKNAPGGRYSYLVKGKLLLGFAMVAYPANYGASGIMTFLVNQEGTVYQKDLGRDTARKAVAMMEYDPDKSWKKVEEPAAK